MLNTGKLVGRTAFITGGSRGIGKEIALKLARDGANIVIAAKTADTNPKLPGTIYSAAEEIVKAGGQCLPCQVDIREEGQVESAVEKAVKKFGGIDILINNASAISLTGTLETPMKRYDLMHQVNIRGTFLVSQKCIPYLKQGVNPHILNISPPLVMETKWFSGHVAYTMAKFGMSMCVLGMAEELRDDNIAVNALWPQTAIWTAAMKMLGGGDEVSKQCRTPSIMADAAYVLLTKDSRNFTGNFAIDEQILKDAGVTDFDQYAVEPGHPLMPDFFLPNVEYPGGPGGSPARQASRQAIENATSGSTTSSSAQHPDVTKVVQQLNSLLSADLVKRVAALYQFSFNDGSGGFYIDLKSGEGSTGSGAPATKADVSFTTDVDTFTSMFQGKTKATAAFMGGKLKIKGDMGKAMKLESLMGEMRSKV